MNENELWTRFKVHADVIRLTLTAHEEAILKTLFLVLEENNQELERKIKK